MNRFQDAAMYTWEDTIAALSTPMGKGAVGVIRVSGPDSITLCEKMFSGKSLSNSPRTMVHGFLRDSDTLEILDDVMCVVFPAPKSFTGEDMAEIHCHGSEAVVRKILEVLYREGIRPAEAGEFTFRAVRNEKMDLTQAEALASLIESRTQMTRSLSLRMLEGAFSQELRKLKDQVMRILVDIETQIEFPDDAMEEVMNKNLRANLGPIRAMTHDLRKRAVREQRFESGVITVLAGKPNVGKSSLFNALLGRNRAIVTPHPGTTRDSIEGTIELNGRPITLIDTAGLRETYEEIEALGIERSRELITSSHIVLFVFEAGDTLSREEEQWLRDFQKQNPDSRIILLGNKSDLCEKQFSPSIQEELNCPCLYVAAVEEKGIAELLTLLEQHVNEIFPVDMDSSFLLSARQESLLTNVWQSVDQTWEWVEQDFPLELLAEEMRRALELISELDGTGIVPDIMNTIFSRFCIGK